MAGVATAMKAGDDQEEIGLNEEKERVGKFLRARPTKSLKDSGELPRMSAMRRMTLSISARKRRPKPGASASYQSCASMSSARAASVKRTGHTTGNAVRVLP